MSVTVFAYLCPRPRLATVLIEWWWFNFSFVKCKKQRWIRFTHRTAKSVYSPVVADEVESAWFTPNYKEILTGNSQPALIFPHKTRLLLALVCCFFSVKTLAIGILLSSPGWDVSLFQGYKQGSLGANQCQVLLINHHHHHHHHHATFTEITDFTIVTWMCLKRSFSFLGSSKFEGKGASKFSTHT